MLALALVLLMTLAGCVTVGFQTTGAASVEDFKAENDYIAVYTAQLTAVGRDLQLFAANGSNPGVCNKGGTKQGCYDADTAVISAYNGMLNALGATTVPPRFVEADRLLRDAITKNVQGLALRNQAIANSDDSAWQEHTTWLEQAQSSWTAAYAAFPADHRPALAP